MLSEWDIKAVCFDDSNMKDYSGKAMVYPLIILGFQDYDCDSGAILSDDF